MDIPDFLGLWSIRDFFQIIRFYPLFLQFSFHISQYSIHLITEPDFAHKLTLICCQLRVQLPISNNNVITKTPLSNRLTNFSIYHCNLEVLHTTIEPGNNYIVAKNPYVTNIVDNKVNCLKKNCTCEKSFYCVADFF